MGLFQTLQQDIAGAGNYLSGKSQQASQVYNQAKSAISSELGSAGNYLSQNVGLNRYAFSPSTLYNSARTAIGGLGGQLISGAVNGLGDFGRGFAVTANTVGPLSQGNSLAERYANAQASLPPVQHINLGNQYLTEPWQKTVGSAYNYAGGLLPFVAGSPASLIEGEGLIPLLGRSALNAGQFGSLSAAQAAGAGASLPQVGSAFTTGAKFGAIPEVSSALTPFENRIGRALTSAAVGYGIGKASGLTPSESLAAGAFSGAHGFGDTPSYHLSDLSGNKPGFIDVGPLKKLGRQSIGSVKNINQSPYLQEAANLFNQPTLSQATRDASGRYITPTSEELVPRQVSADLFEQKARSGQIDQLGINPKSGKPYSVEPMRGMNNQEAVTVFTDAKTGKVVAAQGDPLFYNYLQDASRDRPYAREGYQAYQDFLETKKGQPADLQRNYNTTGMQQRTNPRASAEFSNHPEVPLQTELPPNKGTGSGFQERAFVNTARGSLATDESVKPLLSGDYQTQTHLATQSAAADLIARDPEAALRAAQEGSSAIGIDTALQLSKGAQDQARTLEAAGDTAGAAAARQKAADFINTTAENATRHGQAIEILKTYAKTPEGQALALASDITKYNTEHPSKPISPLSGNEASSIISRQQTIDALPETKPSEVIAKNLAQQKLWEDMADRVPRHGFLDKLLAIRRAGLLTGPKTIGKVVISHVAHPVSESVSNSVGTALDMIVSPFSGFRSQAFTGGSGGLEGAKVGAERAKAMLVHGYDPEASYESIKSRRINWGDSAVGKILQNYIEGVGRVHASLPETGKQAAYQSSLVNLASTEALNRGLKGQAGVDFVKEFVTNPPDQAKAVATEEAKHMVFQNQTAAGQFLQATQRGGGSLASKTGAFVSKLLAPMTQVPSAIGTEVLNYSPAGVVKTITEAVINSKMAGWTPEIQRAFVQGIGRSITGTGLLYLGTKLAKAGIITTGYPSDQKTRDQWIAEGKTANSILINGEWRALGSLGPAGSALILGAYWQQGMDGNKKTPGNLANAAIQTAVGGVASQADQPYVTGISSAANAIVDPERSALTFGKDLASSFVPTALSTAASATDPYQRVTAGIPQAVEAKVPRLRENLPPKVDVFGNTLERTGTPFMNAVDPFYSSQSTATPLTNQLDKIAQSGTNLFPSAVPKSITQFGIKVSLTPDQQSQLQVQIGHQLDQVYQAYFSDPTFRLQDPQAQQSTLSTAASNVRSQIEKQFVANLSPDQISSQGTPTKSSGAVTAASGSGKLTTGKITKTGAITGGVKLSSGRRSGGIAKVPRLKSVPLFKAPKTKTITISNQSRHVGLAKPKLPAVPRVKLTSTRTRNLSRTNRSLRRRV